MKPTTSTLTPQQTTEDTHYNPADLATRGILPRDLIHNSLWWNGPEWLQSDSSLWPSVNKDSLPFTDLELSPILQSLRNLRIFWINSLIWAELSG